VYTAVIGRLREAVWIALGLVVIWFQGGARRVASAVEGATGSGIKPEMQDLTGTR